MNSARPTLASIASEILGMYSALGGARAVADVIEHQNLLGRRLWFLQEAAAGRVTVDSMTQEQAVLFHEILLDATALQGATGGRATVFDSLRVADPARLGRNQYRRAQLRNGDDFQLDWHFQILVQAWTTERGFGPLRDLKDDVRFRGRSSCDFAVARANGRTELLECTRIHPVLNRDVDHVQAVISKITDRLPAKIQQLRSTAEIIGVSACDLHLLIDVSAYGGASLPVRYGDVQVEAGGFQDHELSVMATALTPQCGGLARLTLCWHVPVRLNGAYRAIIQRSKVLLGERTNTEMLDYAGWTVEGYPRSMSEYREFRVSTVARPVDWVVASYNNMASPETFYSIGREVKRK